MIGRAVQPGTDDVITMIGISKFIRPKPKRNLWEKWSVKSFVDARDEVFGLEAVEEKDAENIRC